MTAFDAGRRDALDGLQPRTKTGDYFDGWCDGAAWKDTRDREQQPETCVYCDPDGTRDDLPPATRVTGTGEPVCARHWRENGMYDPDQGFKPTEADYEQFARSGR